NRSTVMGRFRLAAAVVALGLVGQLGLGSTPAQATTSAVPYDFDGDGQPDLVVGAPLLDVAGHHDAGAVAVLAPSTRTVPRHAAVLTQSTRRVVGSSRNGDHFGSAVVSADFDGDGYADLAVGHPDEHAAGAADAGAITILYGSARGLTGTRSAEVTEPGGTHAGARFGAALAAIDLDRDGHPDLAVGAPGDAVESSGTDQGSGSVTILRGAAAGVTTNGSVTLHGLVGTSQAPDVGFGTAFAVADLDGRAGPDLVVLSSGHGGAVPDGDGTLSYCTTGTTTSIGCTRLIQFPAGPTQVVVGKFFDFNDRPEALGPQVVVGGSPGDGSVTVLQIGRSRTRPAYVLDGRNINPGGLGLPAVPGVPERFGASLAAGDVTGDGYDDLVVGAPGGGAGGRSAGRVYVIPGSDRYLDPTRLVAYDQDTPGVPGRAEDGDQFGASVALVDRNRDGKADLVVGSPGEDHGRGRVTVLRGTGTGFTTTGAGAFSLATYGNRQRSTGFGSVLAG
ncbi:MAG: FG-GAP repeat protein, partial [Janthinobacterium lividum]